MPKLIERQQDNKIHPYNLRSKRQDEPPAPPTTPPSVQKMNDAVEHYPDFHRIKISESATGQGSHLRWEYSIPDLSQSSPPSLTDVPPLVRSGPSTPSPASSPSRLPTPSRSSSSGYRASGSFLVPQTPSRHHSFDPGSVIRTPVKGKQTAPTPSPPPLQRSPDRIGGGLNWWKAETSGVKEHVVFARAGDLPSVSTLANSLTRTPKNRKLSRQVQFAPSTHGDMNGVRGPVSNRGKVMSDEDRIYLEQIQKMLAYRERVQEAMSEAKISGFFNPDRDEEEDEEMGSDERDEEHEIDELADDDDMMAIEVESTSQPRKKKKPQPLGPEGTFIIDTLLPPSQQLPTLSEVQLPTVLPLTDDERRGIARRALQPPVREGERSSHSQAGPSSSSTSPNSTQTTSGFDLPTIYPKRPVGHFRLVDGRWELGGEIEKDSLHMLAQCFDSITDSQFKEGLSKFLAEKDISWDNAALLATSSQQSGIRTYPATETSSAEVSRIMALERTDTEMNVLEAGSRNVNGVRPLGWEDTEILSTHERSWGQLPTNASMS